MCYYYLNKGGQMNKILGILGLLIGEKITISYHDNENKLITTEAKVLALRKNGVFLSQKPPIYFFRRKNYYVFCRDQKY